MKKTHQDHFKKRTHQVLVRHLEKYSMYLEAVGLMKHFGRKQTRLLPNFGGEMAIQ